MTLPSLPIANLGGDPLSWPLYPHPTAGGSWTPVVVLVVTVLLVALVCSVRGFLRLRTLSRPAKGVILGGCAVVAAVSALVYGTDVGFYVALGLTLQVTAALNWSERCHALLGGPTWLRIATAVSGVVVAFGIFGTAAILQQGILYLNRTFLVNSGGFLASVNDALRALAPYLTVFTLMLIFAAIQHMRAYFRAREWQLARETGEPPTRPEPEPDAPPEEPS